MQEKVTFASKVKCFRKIQDISVMCLRNNITSNPRIFSKYRYVQNILLQIRGTLLSQTEHIDIVSNQPCRKAIPNFIGTRDWFPGRQFFHRQGFGEQFQNDSSTLYLLCTLFLLLLLLTLPQIIRHLILEVGDPWCRMFLFPPFKCFLSSIFNLTESEFDVVIAVNSVACLSSSNAVTPGGNAVEVNKMWIFRCTLSFCHSFSNIHNFLAKTK